MRIYFKRHGSPDSAWDLSEPCYLKYKSGRFSVHQIPHGVYTFSFVVDGVEVHRVDGIRVFRDEPFRPAFLQEIDLTSHVRKDHVRFVDASGNPIRNASFAFFYRTTLGLIESDHKWSDEDGAVTVVLGRFPIETLVVANHGTGFMGLVRTLAVVDRPQFPVTITLKNH